MCIRTDAESLLAGLNKKSMQWLGLVSGGATRLIEAGRVSRAGLFWNRCKVAAGRLRSGGSDDTSLMDLSAGSGQSDFQSFFPRPDLLSCS